jgi:hypothetical protein
VPRERRLFDVIVEPDAESVGFDVRPVDRPPLDFTVDRVVTRVARRLVATVFFGAIKTATLMTYDRNLPNTAV